MSVALKSLVARIGEHQRKFLAAGGKPKAIKYPEEWQAEAARLAGELKMPLAELAKELGIGHSALQRWCERAKPSRPVKARPKKPSFVPIEVLPAKAGAPSGAHGTARRGGPLRVTLREIAVDLDPGTDEGAISAVIAALTRARGQDPC